MLFGPDLMVTEGSLPLGSDEDTTLDEPHFTASGGRPQKVSEEIRCQILIISFGREILLSAGSALGCEAGLKSSGNPVGQKGARLRLVLVAAELWGGKPQKQGGCLMNCMFGRGTRRR